MDKKSNGIPWSAFGAVLLAIGIVLVLAMLKIYLSNQIYKYSKQLNRLQQQVNALRSERKLLLERIEAMRLRHEVIEPLRVEVAQEKGEE